MRVDFATFCFSGDVHRLHAPGQLRKQVTSNCYPFDKVIVVYQETNYLEQPRLIYSEIDIPVSLRWVTSIERTLRDNGIDVDKPQYTSNTDKLHHWQGHVVNHIAAVNISDSDYIVFADNDCWMVSQPENKSWVSVAISILEYDPFIFIISPNDGEPARKTNRFSQQMFVARTKEFREADFNQPQWDGNVNIPGGPFPEYWALLEGRMELYCRMTGQYRYVLGSEYRYWHHNRLTEDGYFETDMSKY